MKVEIKASRICKRSTGTYCVHVPKHLVDRGFFILGETVDVDIIKRGVVNDKQR